MTNRSLPNVTARQIQATGANGAANAVRRPSVRRGYHHGDLRRELIQAGWTLLETKGVEGLTLRRLATALARARQTSQRRALAAMAAAYVDFAIDHPALYSVMHHYARERAGRS